MSLGTDLRSQINSLINDANFRSSLTHYTKITGTSSDSGYSGDEATYSSGTTIYCIPSRYVESETQLVKMGDLKTGEIRFLIKASETVAVRDKVTFDSNDYTIKSVEPIHFNGINVAQAIILSRKVD